MSAIPSNQQSSSKRSADERPVADRRARIRQVVFDLARRRSEGRDEPDEDVLRRYPELQPELAEELGKLRSIGEALDHWDERRYLQTLERLDADESGSPGCREETRDREDGAGRGPRAEEHLESIGRYRVLRLLGEGGFGRVYLARDVELQRDVAIKVPHRRRTAQPSDIEAYLSEARLAATLDHPAIVPVYDVGRTDDGGCYVVTKLILGNDLASRIEESRIPLDEAVRIVAKVADALHHAHGHGVVHRDIKPANLLIDSDGQPHVADFGLALREEDAHEGRSYAGTPSYMSPEQARGEAHRVDARSDIFSLGVVLYELITGRRPFEAETYDDLLQEVLWSEPIPPRQFEDSIPDELQRICLKAIAKRASDRYASAEKMARDLRWYAEQGRGSSSTVSPGGIPARGQTAGSDPSEPDAVRVVPKGLRSFDANDAHFYLQLVPGPRDRDGIPECIRQWKHRVETSDLDESFAVGLIYGPSGCGKSSLVRAGLLPRLSPRVHAVYVEATAEDTERRLMQRLVQACPGLVGETSVKDCLAALRRGTGLGRGEKLLIVLDQFEQWLQGKTRDDQRSLLYALRQCDGRQVQCLLLVRDDFWLAVGRFMADLEIDLVQGHNSALVDLFDRSHAEKVLAEFGRSFGRLPDDLRQLSPAQKAFLERAVDGLAQEDRSVPVHLALFAEMVKGKDWQPATLRNVGGTQGIGVVFLEETFSARTANPRHRLHQHAARAVLGALLPGPGTAIRGRICANSQLLEISGYGKRPRAFQELVRILDRETRLITPVDPDAVDLEEARMGPDKRFYQLTHDYLVSSLRHWLKDKQKSTRRGRAELRLAERSAMWNTRSERRQLPSVLEWLTIRLSTRATLWTREQCKMMRAAAWHHARNLLVVLALVLVLLSSGVEVAALARNVFMRLRARGTAVWLMLGMDDSVWPLLKSSPDPTLRTDVIHRFPPLVTSPVSVIAQVPRQADVSVRRAMILVAGELAGSPDERTDRWNELRRHDPSGRALLQLYRDDPDPGIHAAARWTLQRYGRAAALAAVDRDVRSSGVNGDRQWYLNGQGHTMMVIPGPESFLMGSPESEPARRADEQLHGQRIRRSFCIASTETTFEQFERFANQRGHQRSPSVSRATADPTMPQIQVTWYEAAAYCNWLSELEGIPPDEWCYLPNPEGQYGPGMKIVADFLDRRGYRLPTEAEWEFACRAGTTTVRYFGSADSMAGRYVVFRLVSPSEPLAVATSKPNDFGLFDMLGNAAEWCQDEYRGNSGAAQGANADATIPIRDNARRVTRGGAFIDPLDKIRSAARDQARPDQRDSTVGFRVARSYL